MTTTPGRSQRRSSTFPPMRCETCGVTTPRRNAMQRYCPGCSADRSRARGRRWAAENPLPATETRAKAAARTVELAARGRAASPSAAIPDLTAPAPDLQRYLRVAVPFDQRMSKNALWSRAANGHVFMRQEIKAVRDALVWTIKASGGAWYDGKVWIDLFVEKPDQRSDAINVIDLVCDAVKVAIDVDDRWFSIRYLDWAIAKNNPRILVGIGQEVTEHHRACSTCGQIKPLPDFTKNRSAPRGHGRVCRGCTRTT